MILSQFEIVRASKTASFGLVWELGSRANQRVEVIEGLFGEIDAQPD